MEAIVEIFIAAGRSAVDVTLYMLLPIMVVMMVLLRMLEVSGILNKLVVLLSPVARPFGLNGLGVVAMVQISFVSFVAPLPTLALMERRGDSDRKLASVLAAVLAMAPANGLFPLTVMGLNAEAALFISMLGGLLAASATYWFFGKSLSGTDFTVNEFNEPGCKEGFSIIRIINSSGAEAIKIVVKIIPMLLMSLVVVNIFKNVGVINFLQEVLSPILSFFGIHVDLVLPALTKYLAGSTALVGVMHDMASQNQIESGMVSLGVAGFLLHPLDLPGLAILLSAGSRVAKTALPAFLGGCLGIMLRTFLGMLFN